MRTRSQVPLSEPPVAAGPFSGREMTMSNTPGNICVHRHASGLQVWILGLHNKEPRWIQVTTPAKPHPRIAGYVLGFKRGPERPTWIKGQSQGRYDRETALAITGLGDTA
jgi:hypothetical protein